MCVQCASEEPAMPVGIMQTAAPHHQAALHASTSPSITHTDSPVRLSPLPPCLMSRSRTWGCCARLVPAGGGALLELQQGGQAGGGLKPIRGARRETQSRYEEWAGSFALVLSPHTRTHTRAHPYQYTRKHAHTHTHVHIHINIHTHTHTRTHTPTPHPHPHHTPAGWQSR